MKLIPLRKTQLRNKISEAMQLGDQDHLISLRCKLVHRFGIEALYDSDIEYKDDLELISSQMSNSLPPEEIEQSELSSEACIINNLDMKKESLDGKANFEPLDHQNLLQFSSNENTLSSQLVENIQNSRSNQPPLSASTVPPIPRLSSFRRWLIPTKGNIPKAS